MSCILVTLSTIRKWILIWWNLKMKQANPDWLSEKCYGRVNCKDFKGDIPKFHFLFKSLVNKYVGKSRKFAGQGRLKSVGSIWPSPPITSTVKILQPKDLPHKDKKRLIERYTKEPKTFLSPIIFNERMFHWVQLGGSWLFRMQPGPILMSVLTLKIGK